MKNTIRDTLTIDGEGIDDANGNHLYTLLLAYDSKWRKTRYIENWESGLSTEYCLQFLCSLHAPRDTIPAAYYFNYDVTMWLRDLSDIQKSALWKSGEIYYRSKNGTVYYLKYIPSKIFFVGEWEQEMGTKTSTFNWPRPHLLIYDVSGFAQRSFVKALSEWEIELPQVAEMKALRGQFTVEMKEQVISYCETEMKCLSEYIRLLDMVFQDEGITLQSWHGGGALASHFLREHKVDRVLADPEERPILVGSAPDVRHAIMSAYFGGRSELMQMGLFEHVYDYDISSAYPAAATFLPNLADGVWSAIPDYDPEKPFALYRVSWRRADGDHHFGPLPFRFKERVFYPSQGAGWYHASEIRQALISYPGWLRIHEGYAWLPNNPGERPFSFVHDLAQKRVTYKAENDPRQTPYKYGLNSLYGKLAQAQVDERRPPFQNYYAAGFITALTRSQLLALAMQADAGRDVVMMATDGLFTTQPRLVSETDQFGAFSLAGELTDAVIVQHGCYWTPTGTRRTRGFHAESLSYSHVRDVWEREGVWGELTFDETRFIGLGQCAGWGEYGEYGRWKREPRTLSLYPEKKFPQGFKAKSIRLLPDEVQGSSQPYHPRALRDPRYAAELRDILLAELEAQDQPDLISE